MVYIKGSAHPVREFWLEDVLWEMGRERRERRQGGGGLAPEGRGMLEPPPAPELNPEEEAGDASRARCSLCGARAFEDWDEYAMHVATCFGPEQPGEGGTRGLLGVAEEQDKKTDGPEEEEDKEDKEVEEEGAGRTAGMDAGERDGEDDGMPLEMRRHVAFFDPESEDAPRAGGGTGGDSWDEAAAGGPQEDGGEGGAPSQTEALASSLAAIGAAAQESRAQVQGIAARGAGSGSGGAPPGSEEEAVQRELLAYQRGAADDEVDCSLVVDLIRSLY